MKKARKLKDIDADIQRLLAEREQRVLAEREPEIREKVPTKSRGKKSPGEKGPGEKVSTDTKRSKMSFPQSKNFVRTETIKSGKKKVDRNSFDLLFDLTKQKNKPSQYDKENLPQKTFKKKVATYKKSKERAKENETEFLKMAGVKPRTLRSYYKYLAGLPMEKYDRKPPAEFLQKIKTFAQKKHVKTTRDVSIQFERDYSVIPKAENVLSKYAEEKIIKGQMKLGKKFWRMEMQYTMKVTYENKTTDIRYQTVVGKTLQDCYRELNEALEYQKGAYKVSYIEIVGVRTHLVIDKRIK